MSATLHAGGSSSFVEDLGMIQMGRGKESVVWQVGLECSYGLPAAIVIETPSGTSQSLSDYTCVMCKSKNCNHLTGLMKHLDIPASSSDIGKFPVSLRKSLEICLHMHTLQYL